MTSNSEESVKICKGILLVKSKSGTTTIEKVLVETKPGNTSNTIKCRLRKFIKPEAMPSKIPVLKRTAVVAAPYVEAVASAVVAAPPLGEETQETPDDEAVSNEEPNQEYALYQDGDRRHYIDSGLRRLRPEEPYLYLNKINYNKNISTKIVAPVSTRPQPLLREIDSKEIKPVQVKTRQSSLRTVQEQLTEEKIEEESDDDDADSSTTLQAEIEENQPDPTLEKLKQMQNLSFILTGDDFGDFDAEQEEISIKDVESLKSAKGVVSEGDFLGQTPLKDFQKGDFYIQAKNKASDHSSDAATLKVAGDFCIHTLDGASDGYMSDYSSDVSITPSAKTKTIGKDDFCLHNYIGTADFNSDIMKSKELIQLPSSMEVITSSRLSESNIFDGTVSQKESSHYSTEEGDQKKLLDRSEDPEQSISDETSPILENEFDPFDEASFIDSELEFSKSVEENEYFTDNNSNAAKKNEVDDSTTAEDQSATPATWFDPFQEICDAKICGKCRCHEDSSSDGDTAKKSSDSREIPSSIVIEVVSDSSLEKIKEIDDNIASDVDNVMASELVEESSQDFDPFSETSSQNEGDSASDSPRCRCDEFSPWNSDKEFTCLFGSTSDFDPFKDSPETSPRFPFSTNSEEPIEHGIFQSDLFEDSSNCSPRQSDFSPRCIELLDEFKLDLVEESPREFCGQSIIDFSSDQDLESSLRLFNGNSMRKRGFSNENLTDDVGSAHNFQELSSVSKMRVCNEKLKSNLE